MQVVSRSGWGAEAPRTATSLSNPQGLAVHWNGPAMRVGAHGNCAGRVRGIQRFHMGPERKWADIAYSFLVCPHGGIFEGRGWGRRTAANGTNEGNSWGHAVMVMVGEGEGVDRSVYAALSWLNAEHRRRYGRSSLRTHSSFKSTACPGPTLTRWVRDNPNPSSSSPVQPASITPEEDDMTPRDMYDSHVPGTDGESFAKVTRHTIVHLRWLRSTAVPALFDALEQATKAAEAAARGDSKAAGQCAADAGEIARRVRRELAEALE